MHLITLNMTPNETFSVGLASDVSTPGYSVSRPTRRTRYFQSRSATSDLTAPSVPSHGLEQARTNPRRSTQMADF